MALRSFVSIGAWVLLLGSAIDIVNNIVSGVLAVASGDGTPLPAQVIIGIITVALLFVGTPILAILQRQKARTLSLVGVGFLMLALLSAILLQSQVLPLVLSSQPGKDPFVDTPPNILVCVIVLTIGIVISGIVEGIAILRAHVLPTGIAWLFFVGVPLQLAAFFLEGSASSLLSTLNSLAFDAALLWTALYALRQRTASVESSQEQQLLQGS